MIRRLVLLLVVVSAAGACTVPTNDAPREIAVEDVPSVLLETTTTSTTTTTPLATKERLVYFLQTTENSAELVPVTRQFELQDELNQVLENLLRFPPDPDNPDESGLVSRLVPDAVELVRVSPAEDGVVTINIRGLFGALEAPALPQALAQLVWTATQDEDVTGVRFENDGVVVDSVGPNAEEVVSREDFAQFAPV